VLDAPPRQSNEALTTGAMRVAAAIGHQSIHKMTKFSMALAM